MGTARLAMTVARRLCKKPKITSTTSTTASTSSNCTCSTEARMPRVRSASTCTSTAAGMPAVSCGSRARMASTVWMTLAPGWRCTLMMMAGTSGPPAWPDQAPRRTFSALSTTWATSFRRTGAPLRQATIRFLYSSAVSSWSLALIEYERVAPSKLPLAPLALAALMALRTVSMAMP